ncbi:probable phytol kinase 1, chloroplastic isoform X1 [Euphorbia lathyris]|uniref:probable phytol kinase 1, chloroplastic isoform X1 n=1 Tax=Euphorbia lathyris TaxID=212925 RepID=UPI0033140114
MMSSLSYTPTPSVLLLRRRLHKSSAAGRSLSFSSTFGDCLSQNAPPIIGVQVLFRFPHATSAPTSSPYFNSRFAVTASGGSLFQDVGATAAVLVGAYGLVQAFDTLTQRNIIQQNLSRKFVHVLSGLLFAISWPIFSTSTEARYFAALVPLVNSIRLLVYGFSLAKDEGLIKSITREGNPKELLRGPLYYVIVLILCALVFWRQSPVGVISIAMMCGGDGVADIVGRRFGSIKLPYNPQKSWAGSISMFISGFLISLGMLYYYSALGCFQLDWSWTIQRVAWVGLVATAVESLSTSETVDDNISVPLTSMLAAYLCFGF